MPSFTLNLQIGAADLKIITDAGEKLVVIKAPTGASTQIIWATAQPFANNQVQLDAEYALYARREAPPIVSMASTDFPTPSGTAFVFDSEAIFKPAKNELPPVGTYRVFNEFGTAKDSTLSFGLVQGVSLNGQDSRERIEAQVVPNQQLADFTPENKVIVWLQSNVAAGDRAVIPPAVGSSPLELAGTTVKSRSTEVAFGGSVNELTYGYDASAGGFVLS